MTSGAVPVKVNTLALPLLPPSLAVMVAFLPPVLVTTVTTPLPTPPVVTVTMEVSLLDQSALSVLVCVVPPTVFEVEVKGNVSAGEASAWRSTADGVRVTDRMELSETKKSSHEATSRQRPTAEMRRAARRNEPGT